MTHRCCQQGVLALRAELCASPAGGSELFSESKFPSNSPSESGIDREQTWSEGAKSGDKASNAVSKVEVEPGERRMVEPSMPDGPDDRILSNPNSVPTDAVVSTAQPKSDEASHSPENRPSEQTVAVYSGSADLMPRGAKVFFLECHLAVGVFDIMRD